MTKGEKKREIKYPVLGANLRQLRTSAELTQQEIATKLGLIRNTYAMWEGGYSRPDLESERKIVAFYNISIDALYQGDPGSIDIEHSMPKPRSSVDVVWSSANKPNSAYLAEAKAANNATSINEEMARELIATSRANREMGVEIGKKAAAEAVRELAANYATKQEVDEVKSSLGELTDAVRQGADMLDDFRRAITQQLALIRKIPVLEMADQIDNALQGGPVQQKRSKSGATGRNHRE